jgi:organic hydroperoxide reductase OsmC/OhrA
MGTQNISNAISRVKAVLQRRPEFGLHDDAPATARWQGGTRIVSSHSNGMQLLTDMPSELGGTGDQVTPGWLFRAGLASCFATCIALRAAAEAIELRQLEVLATSRSDTRGILGVPDALGASVCAGPRDVELRVKIAAQHVARSRLRALVEECLRCSPVPVAVANVVPMALHIEIEEV